MSGSVIAREAALQAHGYNPNVAEALAENDWCVFEGSVMRTWDVRAVLKQRSAPSSKRVALVVESPPSAAEAFRLFLEWNGILGYAETITNALDNCRNVEAQ